MCGIMAYKGNGNAVFRTVIGLEQLEYRGYDSAGIATLSSGLINEIKSEG